MRAIECNYCGNIAELVTGAVLYPHLPKLKDKYFWACMPCLAWVGTHRNSPDHEPLGRLAKIDLRKAKMAAHSAFDPLWQSGRYTKREAYAWLAEQLGIPVDQCHLGLFDLTVCKTVYALCKRKGLKK